MPSRNFANKHMDEAEKKATGEQIAKMVSGYMDEIAKLQDEIPKMTQFIEKLASMLTRKEWMAKTKTKTGSLEEKLFLMSAVVGLDDLIVEARSILRASQEKKEAN